MLVRLKMLHLMSLQVPQFGSLLISEIGETLPSYCRDLVLSHLGAAVKTRVSFGRMDLASFNRGQFLPICDSHYCEICNLNHHPQVQFGDLEARCSRRPVCFRVSFGRTHVQTLRLH